MKPPNIFSESIFERLQRDASRIKADFEKDTGLPTRFAVVDDLLPTDLAQRLYDVFPRGPGMRLLDSFREKKFTSNSLEKFDPLIAAATFAFQDQRVIEIIAEITSLRDVSGDPHLYAGGISSMAKGHFLNPHIDNSHDHKQINYRVLNLLFYVTPGWDASSGGSLELWDEDVTRPVTIESRFNRLVLMATNKRSIHSVNEVKTERHRCCIANYYFSPHCPNDREGYHVTYFQARPEQRVRRVLTKADSEVRSLLRKVKRTGFHSNDLYEGTIVEEKGVGEFKAE